MHVWLENLKGIDYLEDWGRGE